MLGLDVEGFASTRKQTGQGLRVGVKGFGLGFRACGLGLSKKHFIPLLNYESQEI